MNPDYIIIQRPEPHISSLVLAVIATVRMVMPKVPALHPYQICDLFQILPRPTRSNLVYAVIQPELVPAGIEHS